MIWLKDHSVCKGKHNLVENGGRYPTCEAMGTTEYHCTNTGCNYIEEYIQIHQRDTITTTPTARSFSLKTAHIQK